MPLLRKVHGPTQAPEVHVDFALEGPTLKASFRVKTAQLHVNPKLTTDRSAPNLWDFDVVELFLAAQGKSLPYFEFQVSPLNQFFELKIHEPRKKTEPLNTGFRHTVHKKQNEWSATLELPLQKLGWSQKPGDLIGNAFAILGPPPTRAYLSLFLEPQDKPDFHLPQFFRPLLVAPKR